MALRRCGVCDNCLRPALKQGCLALKQQRTKERQPQPCRQCTNCLVGLPCLAPVLPGGRSGRVKPAEPAAAKADEELTEEDEEVEEAEQAEEWHEGSMEAEQTAALPAQQAAGDGSPPPAAGRKARDKFEHDRRYLLFASNYAFARRQHLSNLVLLLRQYAATRDWSRLAGVVATLMASDRPENLSEAWVFRHPESRARLAEALGAGKIGWLLLQQRHPGELSYEQTSRFLKQWAAFQLTQAGKEAVFLELARYSCAQGHATDAWDFLGSQRFSTAAGEARRLALMASIRKDSWAEAMRAAAELQSDISQPPTSSPNKRRRGKLARPSGGWQPWQHDAQVLARGGRLAKELHQEAVDCYSKALERERAASQIARQLAQLQLAGGDTKGALETARRVRHHAPADADAAGLLGLLLVAQPAEQQQPSSQLAGDEEEPAAALPSPAEAAAEAADCCCQLLAADPFCHTAAAALLALHDRHPLPPALLVSSCCTYLEAQPPSWLPPLLELRVWQHLAAALTQAVAAVAAHSRELQALQQQRQLMLPRSLRKVRRLREQRQEGASRAQQRWQQLQELGTAAQRAREELERALVVYRQCCSVMEGRLWWRDAHLLPQPAATMAPALQEGAANPSALLAYAAVNASLHPLWQQRMVAEWRASGGTGRLPHVVQNLMTRHTAAALEQAGHAADAAALRTAAKLCRRAAAAEAAASGAAGGHGALAALASLARQRADFWRAARKPWKPPAGWLPIPQGSNQPQLGRIAALPPQWWAVFPQYRHRSQQLRTAASSPAQLQQPGAEAAAMPPGATALTPQAADTEQRMQQTVQPQHGQEQQGLQQQPSAQQARALRRVQQPGVRSILKGSQPGLDPEWGEPSQQLPGVLLVGSDPTSARGPRRVQFQLPGEAPGGSDDGEAMEEDAGGSGDGSQAPQHSSPGEAAAVAADKPGDGSLQRSKAKGRGKRRLLPQLPPSLAQEDGGESGRGGSTSNASWRQRLQQRRHPGRPSG
ncbi:hypothetical protein ABPG75_009803 [Micractinium tetrahymenae]